MSQINSTNNWAANGWTLLTNGLVLSNGVTLTGSQYVKQRSMTGGRYTVAVAQSNTPAIVCQGYVPSPLGTNEISRAIRITTASPSFFTKGLISKTTISLSGGIQIDSFDSGDPNYSTNGQYAPTRFKDNGDIGSNSRTVGTIINANGTVKVYGHVAMGPGGTVSSSGQASMGSTAWVDGGSTGVEPARLSSNMNATYPDVAAPFSGGAFAPPSGTVLGTGYTYVIGAGNWQMSSFSLSGQGKAIVTGAAVLYVTGSISMSGQSSITIAPGGSLKLYCNGPASLTGNGVANNAGSSTNFFFYGMPGCTSLSLAGNAAFTGVIYAPEADFSMSGGGNNPYDLIGAGIVNSVSMSGHFNFHYDEALSRLGGSGTYTVASWTEL